MSKKYSDLKSLFDKEKIQPAKSRVGYIILGMVTVILIVMIFAYGK